MYSASFPLRALLSKSELHQLQKS